MDYKAHKHYEAAKMANRNIYFDHEKWASIDCGIYEVNKEKLIAAGKEWALDGLEKRFLAYLSSKSRCASSAIVGGGNFNVRKHEKRNAISHKRWEEYRNFVDWALKKKEKQEQVDVDNSKNKTKQYGYLSVTWNYGIDRLQVQIIDSDKIKEASTALKANAFRYAPSTKLWQRQLTGNAEMAARRVMDSLGIKLDQS